ncbi:MAG: hypothetical protein Q4A12_01245 [Eubacteriales bacterium]|nr:hypothetical protein [Eubacteriales bacterium]
MAKSNVMGVVKGVAFGMATGVVAGYVGKKMKDQGKRTMRKKASKALDTMENIASTAKYIFR